MLFVIMLAAVGLTIGAWVSQELLDYLRSAIVHPSFSFLIATLNLLLRVEIALQHAYYQEIKEYRQQLLCPADYDTFYSPSEKEGLALESFFLHFGLLSTCMEIAMLLDSSESPWRDDSRAIVPVSLIFPLLLSLYAVNAIAPTFYYDWPVKTPEGWLVQYLMHKPLLVLDRTPLRVGSGWIRDHIPLLGEEGEIWERRRFRKYVDRCQREEEEARRKGEIAGGEGGDRSSEG